MASPSSPIADLTYRNYDGPLAAPGFRWWSIAKMSMRLSIKKKGFWIWAVLSSWWFFVLSAFFYFADTFAASAPGGSAQFYRNIQWKNQFLDAYSHAQLFLLILSLLIAVGAIANDNRANALLVYLSKPCTKLDYLMGKWVGIFLLLTAALGIPTIIFYLYSGLSYRSYGFFSQDPWLLLKLLAIIPIPAAFHASLSLGVSSMFNQGWLAGAVYAGMYGITSLFTVAIAVARTNTMFGGGTVPAFVDTAFYFSVDGIQIALAKDILGTAGQTGFAGFSPRGRAALLTSVPPPATGLFVGVYLLLCIGAIALAYSRIRAVEVIG